MNHHTVTYVVQNCRWHFICFTLVTHTYLLHNDTIPALVVCLEPMSMCWCHNIIKWHHHCTSIFMRSCCWRQTSLVVRVFSLGGTGGPPIRQKFCQSPPIRHLSPFLDQGLSPPAKVRPRKFEKFRYIFVSNLTTFKRKSTLKSCISCLK